MWEAGASGGGFDDPATEKKDRKRPATWDNNSDDEPTPVIDVNRALRKKSSDPQAFPANKPKDECWIKVVDTINQHSGAKGKYAGLLVNFAFNHPKNNEAINLIHERCIMSKYVMLRLTSCLSLCVLTSHFFRQVLDGVEWAADHRL